MIEALQQAFQAGQNLVERDWHLAEFHKNESCGCQPIGYTDFQEWLETKPTLNFIRARVQIMCSVNRFGEFTYNHLTGLRENVTTIKYNHSMPRDYFFDGPDLDWIMQEMINTVFTNTLYGEEGIRYRVVHLDQTSFDFLTKCGFNPIQTKQGYVFHFQRDQQE